ncbi:MAG TPA: hypothetical protein DD727_04060 [Clostridiales bacterium]|nr:hypothetical protein [Clostridiales bacterium]
MLWLELDEWAVVVAAVAVLAGCVPPDGLPGQVRNTPSVRSDSNRAAIASNNTSHLSPLPAPDFLDFLFFLFLLAAIPAASFRFPV